MLHLVDGSLSLVLIHEHQDGTEQIFTGVLMKSYFEEVLGEITTSEQLDHTAYHYANLAMRML